MSWIISTCQGSAEKEPPNDFKEETEHTEEELESIQIEYQTRLAIILLKHRFKDFEKKNGFWPERIRKEKEKICPYSCCTNPKMVRALGPVHGVHDCCQAFFKRLNDWRLGGCKEDDPYFGEKSKKKRCEPVRVGGFPRSIIDTFKFGIIPKIQGGLGDVKFCDEHIVSLIKHLILDIEISPCEFPSEEDVQKIKDALLTPKVFRKQDSKHILDESRPGMMLNYAEGWEPSDMCDGYFTDSALKRMAILSEDVRSDFYRNLCASARVSQKGFKKSAQYDEMPKNELIALKTYVAVLQRKLKIDVAALKIILEDLPKDAVAILEGRDPEETPPKAGKKPPPPPPGGNGVQ